MTRPGPGAGPSKNYTNTKHLNAEIQMTYMGQKDEDGYYAQ